jgi:hypothetical protein
MEDREARARTERAGQATTQDRSEPGNRRHEQERRPEHHARADRGGADPSAGDHFDRVGVS